MALFSVLSSYCFSEVATVTHVPCLLGGCCNLTCRLTYLGAQPLPVSSVCTPYSHMTHLESGREQWLLWERKDSFLTSSFCFFVCHVPGMTDRDRNLAHAVTLFSTEGRWLWEWVLLCTLFRVAVSIGQLFSKCGPWISRNTWELMVMRSPLPPSTLEYWVKNLRVSSTDLGFISPLCQPDWYSLNVGHHNLGWAVSFFYIHPFTGVLPQFWKTLEKAKLVELCPFC